MVFRIHGEPVKNRQAEELFQQLRRVLQLQPILGYDNDISEREFSGVLNLNYPFDRRFNSQDIADFNAKTGLSVDDYFVLMQEYRQHFSSSERSVKTPALFEQRFSKWENIIYVRQQLRDTSNRDIILIASYFWPKGQTESLFPHPYSQCTPALCKKPPDIELPDWFVDRYISSGKPLKERALTNNLAAVLVERYGSFTSEDVALFLDLIEFDDRAYSSSSFKRRKEKLLNEQSAMLEQMSDVELLEASVKVTDVTTSLKLFPLLMLSSPVYGNKGEVNHLIRGELVRREMLLEKPWSTEALDAAIDAMKRQRMDVKELYHTVNLSDTPTPLLLGQLLERLRQRFPGIEIPEKNLSEPSNPPPQ